MATRTRSRRGEFDGRGKDPANTLLAQFFDDPRLDRIARGTYSIRAGASKASRRGPKRK